MAHAYYQEYNIIYIMNFILDMMFSLVDESISTAILYACDRPIAGIADEIKELKRKFPADYKYASDDNKAKVKKEYEAAIREKNKQIIDLKYLGDQLSISNLFITMGLQDIYNAILAGYGIADVFKPMTDVPPSISLRMQGDIIIKAGHGKELVTMGEKAASPTIYAKKAIEAVSLGAKIVLKTPKWAKDITAITDDTKAFVEGGTTDEYEQKVEGYEKEINDCKPS